MATKTLHLERIFNAPVQKVWDAWTIPEEIVKWWGPEGFTSPSATVDLRVGGKYMFCMRGPAGTEFDKDMFSGGEYLEIVPLKKIVATDNFADENGNYVSPAEAGMPGEWPEQMVVTTTFEDMGDGTTKMTIKHEGHPAEMAEMAEQGWNGSLDKMEKMF